MSLAAIWTVAGKELVDLLRDRKTMALSLLLGPVMIPVLILGMGTLAEKKMRTQLESTLELPVVGAEHAPNLVAFLETRNIKPTPAPEDPDRSVREQEHDLVLRIDAEYGGQWRGSRPAKVELVYDSSRQDSQIPVGRVRGVLHEYSRTVAVLRGIHRGVSPEAGVAVQVGQRDVATPEARRGMMLVFLPYMLILFSFLGGAALVIDVTAGERERQSLEPLLATPSSRSALMSGKILAATALGMLSQLLILVALVLPAAAPLLGMFCFGNLMRECGVVNRLSETAQNALINITTIFLGLAVGSKLEADKFLDGKTLGILLLGILAFAIGTAAGVVMALGGPLSHACIVAREYGIPTVVNVHDVMARVRTGDMITVDGDRGLVLLHAPIITVNSSIDLDPENS